MEPVVIKVSNLLNLMGMLAHSVNSGIKPSVDHQTKRVMEQVNEMVTDIPNRDSWRSYANPQEVFIEPEAVHAFIKLQSTVATFITAFYHNNTALTQAAVMTIKGYLNKVRVLHGLKEI